MRRRKRKQNKIIFISFISLLFLFSVGYCAFSSDFLINGRGTIIKNKDFDISDLKKLVVTSGEGLYADEYEEDRFIFRGSNPNNHIMFDNMSFRIVSIEDDGTLKIIADDKLKTDTNENIPWQKFDVENARATTNNSYCTNANYGCGVFASVAGNFVTPYNDYRGTVTQDSSIKNYLNETYYNLLSEESKELIATHTFNIGAVEALVKFNNNSSISQLDEADSMEKNINGEKMHTWTGKIGLINVSDVLRASLNSLCSNATANYHKAYEAESNNNMSVSNICNDSYFYKENNNRWWTMNAFAMPSVDASHVVWYVYDTSSGGFIYVRNAYDTADVRPVFYIKATSKLSGKGTSADPFTLSS